MAKWWALVVLGAAQFLMVLDAAVMNVSISQLVEDFDTTVTTIQGVITFYALVMAALMVTGGKLGDLWGRRRAFLIGHVIYGAGSLLTALAWSVPALALGWSVLEGIGAALVLPALAALAAGNYQGRDRSLVYGVLGGVSGVGIAVGPILGGWVTTYLTWRIVFLGEVVLVVLILLATPRFLQEAPREGAKPELDWVGSVLSALGLGLMVFGVLRASTWGWLKPHDSPAEPLGFSLTPFVVAGGIALLAVFRSWERRREEQQREPLVHFRLFAVPSLRAGLQALLAQNLILMGVFFSIPLYLQIVQGYNAFDTGVRMLPISISLFVSALVGSAVSSRWSARTIVRIGFAVLTVSILLLIGSTEPELDSWDFAVASTILGFGLGLVSSQLGNVVQSAVDEADRSEAGGLQYTAQQLGGSLGTALIGAIVISGLVTAFSNNVASDPDLSAAAQEQVGIQLESSTASFVSVDQVRTVATEAGLSESDVDEIVDSYSDAQLFALRTGLLVAAFIAGVSLLATRGLPARPFSEVAEPVASDAQLDPVASA